MFGEEMSGNFAPFIQPESASLIRLSDTVPQDARWQIRFFFWPVAVSLNFGLAGAFPGATCPSPLPTRRVGCRRHYLFCLQVPATQLPRTKRIFHPVCSLSRNRVDLAPVVVAVCRTTVLLCPQPVSQLRHVVWCSLLTRVACGERTVS